MSVRDILKMGDPRLLRLVLQNLLSNALKYSRDTPDSRVEVRGGATAGGRWLEVRDNGIGFDMAQAHKLFQAFERLHGGGFEGHGIGLAQVVVNRFAANQWVKFMGTPAPTAKHTHVTI